MFSPTIFRVSDSSGILFLAFMQKRYSEKHVKTPKAVIYGTIIVSFAVLSWTSVLEFVLWGRIGFDSGSGYRVSACRALW